jgi:DNA-directed RNA polymerase specialized sigma24 family protein
MVFAEKAGTDVQGLRWHSTSWWLEKNNNLLYWLAAKVRRRNAQRHIDMDELVGEIAASAYLVARYFRPQGTQFSSYWGRFGRAAATGHVMDNMRRGVSVPQRFRFILDSSVPQVSSFPEISRGDEGEWEPANPEQQTPPVDPDFWDRAVVGLTDKERDWVLRHFRNGESYASIGLSSSLSKEGVRKIIGRACRKIKENSNFVDSLDPGFVA